jgi:hypothetical protein
MPNKTSAKSAKLNQPAINRKKLIAGFLLLWQSGNGKAQKMESQKAIKTI